MAALAFLAPLAAHPLLYKISGLIRGIKYRDRETVFSVSGGRLLFLTLERISKWRAHRPNDIIGETVIEWMTIQEKQEENSWK